MYYFRHTSFFTLGWLVWKYGSAAAAGVAAPPSGGPPAGGGRQEGEERQEGEKESEETEERKGQKVAVGGLDCSSLLSCVMEFMLLIVRDSNVGHVVMMLVVIVVVMVVVMVTLCNMEVD